VSTSARLTAVCVSAEAVTTDRSCAVDARTRKWRCRRLRSCYNYLQIILFVIYVISVR